MSGFLKQLLTQFLQWFQKLFGNEPGTPNHTPSPAGPLETPIEAIDLLDIEVRKQLHCPDGTGNTYAFHMTERMDCTLLVTMKIFLKKIEWAAGANTWNDPQNIDFLKTRKEQWKDAIERYWSNQHRLLWTLPPLPPHRADDRLHFPECDSYRIFFRVEWVGEGEQHVTVNVKTGISEFDSMNWILGNENSGQGYIDSAAHEFGHLLGLCHDSEPEDSIMKPGYPGNTVLPHHYLLFAKLLTDRKQRRYFVEGEEP